MSSQILRRSAPNTQREVIPSALILPNSVFFTSNITSQNDLLYLFICLFILFICLISLPPQVPTKTLKTSCPWFCSVLESKCEEVILEYHKLGLTDQKHSTLCRLFVGEWDAHQFNVLILLDVRTLFLAPHSPRFFITTLIL